MSALREAAQQALEALENDVMQRTYAGGIRISNAAIALRAALAQQEQEPLSVEDLARALVASRVIDPAAIDDPEGYDGGLMLERVRGLHRRLAALAQKEQEPVAWIQPDHLQKARQAPFLCRVEPTKRMSDFVPIYTHPPRREWQSLTDDEIWELYYDERIPEGERSDRVDFARAIEAALKERNT